MTATFRPVRGGEPTRKQVRILQVIIDWIRLEGWPPTVREIAKECNIGSPNGVLCHLVALRKKGLIEFGGEKARRIIVRGLRMEVSAAASPEGRRLAGLMGWGGQDAAGGTGAGGGTTAEASEP